MSTTRKLPLENGTPLPVDLDAISSQSPRVTPSGDLLNFYRQKVATLTSDNAAFQGQLDKISDAINEQNKLSAQLAQNEAANFELQEKLSRLEALLHQEKSQVMRLCAENNRLKLRERDDARRIDFLLKISGMRPAEAALFMSQSICLTRSSSTTSVMENDAAPRVIDDSQNPIVVNPKKPILGTVECTVTGAVRRMKPNELSGHRLPRNAEAISQQLALWDAQCADETIASLRKQLEEQATTAESQIARLLEDQQQRIKEGKALAGRHLEKEEDWRSQLKRYQSLLQENAQEYLHKMEQFRITEKIWIAEKEHLIAQREYSKGCASRSSSRPKSALSNARPVPTVLQEMPVSNLEGATRREFELRRIIKDLEMQFDRQQQLASLYHDQVLQAEEKLNSARLESGRSQQEFTNKSKKLNEKLQVYIQRYQCLERRRKLEIEGYSTDITSLKKKLADTEKRLEQLSSRAELDLRSASRASHESELSVLQKMHKSTLRSRVLASELTKLKQLIYNLEDGVRCI